MEVLIYRYGSVCEPDVIETLKRMNFDVVEEITEVFNKEILPAEAMQNTLKHLEKHQFVFVFTINFFPWLSDLCNIYNLTYISLIVDSPVMELYSESLSNPCNRIFLFDSALYHEFAPYNPEGVFYTPLATNVIHNDSVCDNATPVDINRFKADISFVGSLYSEKCLFNDVVLPPYEQGVADALIEAQLKVYGYNFIEEALTQEFVDTFCKHAKNMFPFDGKYRVNYKALVAQQYLSVKVGEQERIRFLRALSEKYSINIYTNSDTTTLPKLHKKGFVNYRTEMPLIFRHSKINLNLTAKSIRNGLSQRVFDVLGCGGFLITNYQQDLEGVFHMGTDLEVYSSYEELQDKIAYYLKHDSERQKIAVNGYEKVKRLHTYDTRLVEMLGVAFPE